MEEQRAKNVMPWQKIFMIDAHEGSTLWGIKDHKKLGGRGRTSSWGGRGSLKNKGFRRGGGAWRMPLAPVRSGESKSSKFEKIPREKARGGL